MAKIFLEFESKSIDIYQIKLIEKFERWNDEDIRMDYTIEINRPYHESTLDKMPFKFIYRTEKLRDERLETLKMMLTDKEVEFLETGL